MSLIEKITRWWSETKENERWDKQDKKNAQEMLYIAYCEAAEGGRIDKLDSISEMMLRQVNTWEVEQLLNTIE